MYVCVHECRMIVQYTHIITHLHRRARMHTHTHTHTHTNNIHTHNLSLSKLNPHSIDG